MNKPPDYEAREFHVETKFQQMAKRPGGVSRDQALTQAQVSVATLKPGFETWLDDEIALLLKVIPKDGDDHKDQRWMATADIHCQHLADVSATMGYEFVSYVASNLCLLFDAIKQGADYRRDVMTCHVDALLLGRKDKFRRMKPEDVPELTEGLRRVLTSPKLKAPTAAGSTTKS
jgi:hypothetical protein